MPDLSVSDAQLEELEAISEELEAVYVGEYGTVRPVDALQYLLDTYTPPDAADGRDTAPSDTDIDLLTDIDGVGEATAKALFDAGMTSVEAVSDADPASIADIRGVSREQAVDIAAAAASLDSATAANSTSTSDADDNSDPDTPEDTLQQAMSLLDAHDERWRESSEDEPYEVDLPDGSTTGVRTKDDIKRLLFKHWR